MVNGPLGGNMGTPPVPPQPPQVSFTTTAESRGGFNNFLKSIPQTTAMTPIPPLGSAPIAPMSNPMGNIDIFNQPPSTGMGMMGMNQPQMNPMMQQPMQQPMNMGVGLMGTPVQNFYNGGGVDDFSDFGGFSDSSDPFGGGDSFNDSNDTSDPSIGSDSEFNEQNFQDALDNLNLGSDAPSDDSMFSNDPAIVDRRGINVGLENTGKFTTGVVPNLRGERFARFESVPFAQRALGRDFQTKVNRNVLNEAGDNALTYGDYFEKFTPSSENPGGTGNRMAEFTKATGKGPNDMLSINDMNNIMDIQGKYEAGIRNNPAGQIEKISTTVPMNDDKQIANILDNLDLSKDLALDKVPTVTANTLPPPSDYEENVGVTGTRQDRLGQRQGINYDLDYNTKGTTPKEQAELRELRDIDDAEFNPKVLEATDRGGRFGTALASDTINASRMPGTAVAEPFDKQLTEIDPFDIQPTFQNTGLAGANLPTIGSARSTVAEDQAKALANLVGDRDQTIGEKLQQNILEERGRALGPTTFRDDAADVTFGNIRGQTPTTDTVFDIDTTDTRNFVGDDFQTALDLVDARQEARQKELAELAERDANVRDMDDIDRASAGRASDFPTLSTSTRPEDYEENVGRAFNANRMADIERLYNLNVGQTKAGKGIDPSTGQRISDRAKKDFGFSIPSPMLTIADLIENKSRENMANEIALGRPMGLGETLFGYDAPSMFVNDKGVGLVRNSEGNLVPNFRETPGMTMKEYMANTEKNFTDDSEATGDYTIGSREIPENQLVRNDSGRVIGIYNEKGRLVSGYDPDAPPVDTGDDNDSNPLILRRIAKEKEEEKEDKTPNVFGGSGSIAPITPKSVVVDSPFTTSVGDYSPTGFDAGDLNALIARLLKTSNPKSMKQGGVAEYAQGGRVMQALDNLLATG